MAERPPVPEVKKLKDEYKYREYSPEKHLADPVFHCTGFVSERERIDETINLHKRTLNTEAMPQSLKIYNPRPRQVDKELDGNFRYRSVS